MGNNGSRRLHFYRIPMPLYSLHSFCSVRSHLLESLERQILCIWEQREDFSYYLGTEGVSPYGGNRGSLKYEHVNGRVSVGNDTYGITRIPTTVAGHGVERRAGLKEEHAVRLSRFGPLGCVKPYSCFG